MPGSPAATASGPMPSPAAAFADYIAAKIEASRRQPYASKVFANEILHGAPQLDDYLARSGPPLGRGQGQGHRPLGRRAG